MVSGSLPYMGMRPRKRKTAIALAFPLLSAGLACRAAFRYPTAADPVARPPDEVLRETMNPYLLTNLVSRRVVFEIDWVEGAAPHPKALAGFEATLRQHLPEGKELILRVDDEIPLWRWAAETGSFAERAARLGEYLDGDPAAWDRAELAWVLYVPGTENEFVGWTERLAVEADGAPRIVEAIFLFQETIRSKAALWITPTKSEKSVLVHEAGHLLGLVRNPTHEEQGNPGHCTEPPCVMAHQRTRAQFYNALPAFFAGKIPDDFGDRCRADIRRARELWAERADEPGYVERLKRRRAARELRDRACWHARHERWVEAVSTLAEARRLGGAADDPPDRDGSRTLVEFCAGSRIGS